MGSDGGCFEVTFIIAVYMSVALVTPLAVADVVVLGVSHEMLWESDYLIYSIYCIICIVLSPLFYFDFWLLAKSDRISTPSLAVFVTIWCLYSVISLYVCSEIAQYEKDGKPHNSLFNMAFSNAVIFCLFGGVFGLIPAFLCLIYRIYESLLRISMKMNYWFNQKKKGVLMSQT